MANIDLVVKETKREFQPDQQTRKTIFTFHVKVNKPKDWKNMSEIDKMLLNLLKNAKDN